MKKGKKIIYTLIVIIIGLGIIGCWCTYNFLSYTCNGSGETPVFKEQKSIYTILSQEEMNKDLDFLVETLKDVHPKAYKGLSKMQEQIINNAYKQINNDMSIGDFFFIANEVICSFKDAHTMMYIDINDNNRIIDLPIIWLNDGMYINKKIGNLEEGDKILSIGGKTPEELLIQLSKITPAENDNWVKILGTDNIIKEPYLKYLNLVKDNYVNIQIKRNNEKMQVKLPLISSNTSQIQQLNKNKKANQWVNYTIDKDNSLGVFRLDRCIYNDEYKDTLNNFFNDVSEYNIQNIAVDVRNNTGGNSQVIDEFIRYLDVNKYLSYSGDVRYSIQASQQRGMHKKSGYKSYPNKYMKNKKIKDKKLIFKGNTYILTSSLTFSSANWFGVIFKDNKLGKIIGEPTGNQPSSYGDVLAFQLPNSTLEYQVSFKKWVRPNPDNDPEAYLTPDIIVYTKIDDIINNRDAQIEHLKKIIKK